MKTESEHVRDEIETLLDGRLDEVERERVERHLAGCEACERARRALSRLRDSLRADLRRAAMPADLPSSLAEALDRQDADSVGSRVPVRLPRVRIFAVAAVAAALVALAVFLTRPRELPAVVAKDYAAVRAGRLALEIETPDPEILEKFFADRGVGFRTRVFDLRMMGYHLAGGTVLGDAERKRALFVYRGEGGEVLICEMYAGDVRDLPRPSSQRSNEHFTFLVFQASRQTQVFWQEDDVVCVLASDIPSEEVVQLAMAKAMKAQGAVR